MQFREKSKRRIIINITSLIDVLFILLIFFMVSSTFLEQPGMKLDLPKTSQKTVVQVEGYTLFIMSDESLYLNHEEITIEALPARLKEIAKEVEDKGIVLQADEKIRYGWVVEIMDVIKQSGITKLIVATRMKEDTD